MLSTHNKILLSVRHGSWLFLYCLWERTRRKINSIGMKGTFWYEHRLKTKTSPCCSVMCLECCRCTAAVGSACRQEFVPLQLFVQWNVQCANKQEFGWSNGKQMIVFQVFGGFRLLCSRGGNGGGSDNKAGRNLLFRIRDKVAQGNSNILTLIPTARGFT